MTRILLVIIAVMVTLLIGVGLLASHYHSNAIVFKSQRDKAAESLKQANATINDMQVRQRDVAALDAKYTQELADAKATIDQLHDDVANGKRRLRLNASCEKQSASASGMDDAAAAELTPDARQNYFRLREQLVTAEKQILGLQEYIRTVVFDEKSKSNKR